MLFQTTHDFFLPLYILSALDVYENRYPKSWLYIFLWSSNQQVETIVRTQPKVGRNDKVNIKNVKTGETKELKYKHAENLISSGEWIITNK